MKSIILFCLVTLASASVSDKIQALKNQCLQSSGVNTASVENLRGGVFDDNNTLLKKYVSCVTSRAGIITNSGDFNKVVMRKALKGSESEINSLIETCAVKKDSVDETSYASYKCIYGINPASLP